MARTRRVITSLAQKHGLDPRAVLAVAMGEGGVEYRPGAIGDVAGGGSYGPFQLYAQGALPSRFRGNPKAADKWAWSPQGIDYALRQMKKAGASGLTGRAAVETIVRKFERPADPDGSVQRAWGRYEGVAVPKSQGGSTTSYGVQPASARTTPSSNGSGVSTTGAGGVDPRREAALALLEFASTKQTPNSIARLTGAVSRLGTVQPPPVVEPSETSKRTGKGSPTVSTKRNSMQAGVVDRVLSAAHEQIGKPYVFGSGPSTDSFDCSDLVQWAWGQVGVDIPRTTYEQIKVLPKKSWKNLAPGDLIYKNDGGHVVMYVGGGKVVAAPYTGTVVQYQPLSRFKGKNYHVRSVM
jgi:cell wall-associated NlpC family hydrolase